MANTDLGKVSLTPRGNYDPAAQYERLDLVEYQGSGFVALRSVQGVEPVDGEEYMLLAKSGRDGLNGQDGVTPRIGDNGNWWNGNVDTGVAAHVEVVDNLESTETGKALSANQGRVLKETLDEHLTNHPSGGESVDDGAITTEKLADGAVTPQKTSFIVTQGESTSEVENFTNVIPSATDQNGAIYNEIGYKPGVYIDNAGAEKTFTTASVGGTTGFIPVAYGDVIRFKGGEFLNSSTYKSYESIAFYDSSKKLLHVKTAQNIEYYGWVGTVSHTEDGETTIIDTKVPSAAQGLNGKLAYIRITYCYPTGEPIITINEEITYSTVVVPGSSKLDESIKVPHSCIIGGLSDKKVVCFGDSIFGMCRDDTSVASNIAKKTSATVYNIGFGGCRMSNHPTTGYNEFCMYALADAISTNNFSTQDGVTPGQSYFTEVLETLKSIEFSNVDMIVIHFGTNDFGAGDPGVELDNTDNKKDTSTLCGAFRYSVEKIMAVYPQITFFVSVPTFRTDKETSYSGKPLKDYVDALKNVASEYHFKVIDGFNELGVNSTNATSFLADGTHHNELGRKRLGELIGSQLY